MFRLAVAVIEGEESRIRESLEGTEGRSGGGRQEGRGGARCSHHSDGILSHLSGGWRRERRRLIKECICHQFLRVLFKI